jgi:RNA polymerase sigma-70 factor (ECF subfamily)
VGFFLFSFNPLTPVHLSRIMVGNMLKLDGQFQVNRLKKINTKSDCTRDVKLSQRGDLEAFRRLVESHQHYAFSLAFRLLGNRDDADDIVQEAFVRIWKHIGRFDFRSKFTTWMYRIVVNLCHDLLKQRNRRERALHSQWQTLEVSSFEAENIEVLRETAELADLVVSLARYLPERQREVFVLRDLQNLSVSEVANILGISKSSVKANLCYARKNIRQLLDAGNGPEVRS